MRIGRTLPPAAAPLGAADLWTGMAGLFGTRAIATLEESLRRHFGVRHVFLVSSGTAALTLTLTALRSLSRGSEAVVPAYTCPSVPAAVMKAGLRPALCDIDPATFDFDHAMLEQTLSGDTVCVVAHHLFGMPSDVERLRALCRGRRIFVVEDAAQAMGAAANGRPLGTLGDAGIFSLGRGKNITCGSGGIIVTNADDVAAAIARHYRSLAPVPVASDLRELALTTLMMLFIRPSLYWIPAALPFLQLGETVFPKEIRLRRMSALKAGMLKRWRVRLEQANRARSTIAADLCGRLPLRPAPGPSHPYLRLPLVAASAREKRRLHTLSQARGLGLSVAYPAPLDAMPEMRAAANGRRFPAARRMADCLLTLPTHAWVTERDRQAIAELCRSAS